jgi:hypothetical protein
MAMVGHRMQQQSFRRATLADVGAIVEITRAAYAKWVAVIGREPRPMTANYHQAASGHYLVRRGAFWCIGLACRSSCSLA